MDVPFPAPKRRWFRFGLRTLFVATTLVACVLIYPLNWIHQRHTLLRENIERYKWVHSRGTDIWNLGLETYTFRPPVKAPLLLRIFGEEPVEEVAFLFIVDQEPDGVTQEMQRAKELFPEAIVYFSLVDRNGKHFPAKPED